MRQKAGAFLLHHQARSLTHVSIRYHTGTINYHEYPSQGNPFNGFETAFDS